MSNNIRCSLLTKNLLTEKVWFKNWSRILVRTNKETPCVGLYWSLKSIITGDIVGRGPTKPLLVQTERSGGVWPRPPIGSQSHLRCLPLAESGAGGWGRSQSPSLLQSEASVRVTWSLSTNQRPVSGPPANSGSGTLFHIFLSHRLCALQRPVHAWWMRVCVRACVCACVRARFEIVIDFSF